MKKISITFVVLISFLFLYQCSSDDDNTDVVIPGTKQYPVNAVANSGISGIVKIIKNEDLSITYEIQLTGTMDGEMYPASINYNTAVESGAIAKVLSQVDGTTGSSITTSTELEPGTPVTYEEMLEFSGHINIVTMFEGVETIVAQADIGINEITSTQRVYNFTAINASGISGTFTIKKRLTGEALGILQLNGTEDAITYTSHIHHGSVSEGGSKFITLHPVDGAVGYSETHIESSDGPEIVGYDDLIVFDGHVDVHAGDINAEVVANANIGSNQ